MDARRSKRRKKQKGICANLVREKIRDGLQGEGDAAASQDGLHAMSKGVGSKRRGERASTTRLIQSPERALSRRNPIELIIPKPGSRGGQKKAKRGGATHDALRPLRPNHSLRSLLQTTLHDEAQPTETHSHLDPRERHACLARFKGTKLELKTQKQQGKAKAASSSKCRPTIQMKRLLSPCSNRCRS